MRLFLALGPGDIVGASRSAQEGQLVPGTSIPFSEQILEYCRSHQIETLAISSNVRSDERIDTCIRLENRPRESDVAGLRYHLMLLRYAIYLAQRARAFGADIAILDSGTTHYFALFAFRIVGIKVAINMHNSLWPAGYPPTGLIERIVRLLNRVFFRHGLAGALGVSPECERQLKLESGTSSAPFFQYRCQFSPVGFERAQDYSDGPFRIAYVGRVEKNKGALDLVDIALHLQSRGMEFVFDVCGDGAVLSELRANIKTADLVDRFVLHGHLSRERLLQVYSAAHSVIVPTTSQFCEGMPQACAEAVLSGLPIVTSKTSNALDVVGGAILEVQTDDAQSYANGLIKLMNDPGLRRQLKVGCEAARSQFLDTSKGYAASVDRLISSLELSMRFTS